MKTVWSRIYARLRHCTWMVLPRNGYGTYAQPVLTAPFLTAMMLGIQNSIKDSVAEENRT
jgi:hypothetical protein